jgi:hypothetical protein
MSLQDVTSQLVKLNERVVLIYAFNATGKTRLSVAFKDATKNPEDGRHAGVYTMPLAKIFLFGTMI